ncbi:helix-turn-helix transcriptional regulator [Streptomyces yerevanensis]|uniref:helix-turn-helix transcriptional regulator n=1 Tax=Streptomyces yerevanensis TaxID=66378 RepID=UPI0007C53B3D|nr:LuxR family transcriptional regulator [Streptomyces yerevanensis]
MTSLRSSDQQPSAPRQLLGRDEERQTLDELIDAVREGLSGALVLAGEAGIGKTRLLEYALEAADDLRTVKVVGMEAEARLGFAALHRLLLPFLGGLDQLPAPQQDALRSAFGLVAGPPADRFLTALATLTLLSDAARPRPLLCLVDDAQWLDRESMEVLAFVGRRLHADGIGLLLGVRDGTDGRTGFAVLDGLPALRLKGLPEPDARRLLASTSTGPFATPAFTRIVAETQGNPLALIELAGELMAGPLPSAPLPIGPRLEAHFLRQVRAMPQETQALLLVAALAPSDDPAVLWRAAAQLGLSAHAMDPAMTDGILARGRHPAFRHPLIRSAIHAGAQPAERRQVHRALAAATDQDAAPDRRAWHLAEAALGLDEEIAAELERASERAKSRGGYAAQANFLARAAELTPNPRSRAERYFTAAQAHLVIGDVPMARAVLQQAVPGLGTPVTRASAQRLHATIEWFQGRAQKAPSILMAAAAEVLPFDERLARDMVFEALAAATMMRQHMVGMTLDELARTVLALPWNHALPALPPDTVVDAYSTRIAGGYAPAVPKLRAAVESMSTGELVETGMPIALLGYVAAEELWDDRGLRAVVERLSAASRAQGALHALHATLNTLAATELWAGRFKGAEACFDEADEISRALGMPPQGTAHRVELLAWQGRDAETRAGADIAAHVWDEQLGYATMANHAHYALTILELASGRYPEALAWALLGYDNDVPGQGSRLLPDLVEAATRAGNLAAASAAIARLSERATLSGTPWALGVLARSRALLTDGDEAETLYEEAVKHLGNTRVVTELARTHLLYGEWLRRRKLRTHARAQLRTAHDMFTTMDAHAFAERARLELMATGEHARKRTGPGQSDHALTPQERQVAGHAAAGSTNAEIATRLFITASTVEYHLNKVFRKLSITSRRQLATLLRDEDQPR